MERAPIGLIEDILDMRAYANTKSLLDNAKNEDDVPESSMKDLVMDIQLEIIRERKQNG